MLHRQTRRWILYRDLRKKETKVLVDPVMGDDGEEYPIYTEELCEKMRMLVREAAVITPNITEALLLLYGREKMHNRMAEDFRFLRRGISEICPDDRQPAYREI